MKKILISTGGGDCPGLNAVIRGIVRAAQKRGGYEVWGSLEAFNGIMEEPPRLLKLDRQVTSGIHTLGGTIIKTTNKGNPLEFPVQQKDGSWKMENRCQNLVDKIKNAGFDAVINIGGDGSQKISMALHDLGLPIVGVPKTIDNDLAATELTFGFMTAVQTATSSFDRLVTTASSHHRVIIMEVMGRHAGWIGLYAAIAGGAEICIIPEIPYEVDKIVERIQERYDKNRGFVNIVIAEGARPKDGDLVGEKAKEIGDQHIKLGGIANFLRQQLEEHPGMPDVQVRTTILGHVQRGGTPVAQDRILATSMGVKAFDLVDEGRFGRMVSFKNHDITDVALADAVKENKIVNLDHYLVQTARKMGVSFGD